VVKIITSSADVLDLGINSSQNNLLITKDAQSALQLIEYFDGDPNFVLLENSELLPYDFFSMAPIIRAKRIAALSSLLKRKGVTLISSINTILSPLPHPSHISPINNLSVNDQFNPEKIIQEITDYGYIREDFVSEPGQYALRGSIMDIFLTSRKNPIRIEFFDNTIESIRTFNPESQIADEKIDSLNFLPSFEYPLNPEAAETFKQEWRRNFDIFENDSEIFTKVMSLRPAEGVEIYLPLFYKQKTSILSYLNHIDEICVQRHTDIKAYAFEDLIKERYEEYRYDLRRPLLAPEDLFLNFLQLSEFINKDKSFDFDQPNIAETTDNSIELTRNEKADISSSKMPDPGDLVVHLSHGIGRFVGLKQLNTFVGTSDCLEISYKDDSKVFVPIENMDLVSKYFGPDDRDIDSLNSKKWKKRKDKALKQTFDTAAELLEVQAKRNGRVGFAFDIDEKEFSSFVSKFPYEETYDQKKTIEEVTSDMQSQQPMDRLICGEVGFGKTEVAMRAAFIAALNNKQTCILVPTTLLAAQHFASFEKRFQDSGISIAALSRNITLKEKEKLLQDLGSGEIDIVIGTHALLQGNIRFNDLGLLIIDEEHRFGVRQKEKIKTLKEEVEILSLSATPIPRSLNFALSELKDLSIIATAPDDRLPVKTFTYSFNENLIHEAIQREILRGGQTYYLCNDLTLIQDRRLRLKEKFEDLVIEIVHGQLKPKVIEEIMLKFNSGLIDVLVCSTIIESGIDVSNANTLIVEDADKFGLSQLHQLRGRVGRSEKQAYAYFLRSKNIVNKKNADKRFDALMSADSLSAGFLLALKDLEIRGAGEILGSNQSGVFESIGLELYTRMIKKASEFIKSGEMDFQSLDESPEININVNCFIPEDYLPDINVRLLMYNKIALAETNEELKNIQIEMINRFGLLPNELKNFFLQAELKIAAENFSIKKINFNKNKISISYKNEELNTSLFNDDKLEDKVKMTMDVMQAINKNVS
jgi:transcription-repair coupling factor (superfamily II helicase)